MSSLITYNPKNLPEYLRRVEMLQRRARQPLWFRGAGVATHALVPSLYRHPSVNSSADLEDLERQLMVRFRQRSIPYHSRDLSNDWEAVFFMQHYGVPTRLLDWTENPLTGLHFAMMSAPKKANQTQYTKSAAIWILDPVKWNQTALKHVSYTGEPLTAGDEGLKGYSPLSPHEDMAKHPVALYGAHNSARIVAQQGVFTIFGTDQTPMEKLVKKKTFPSNALCRVVVPAGRIPSMRKSLLNQGITESTIFPDFEGLARETKRHFGFEA